MGKRVSFVHGRAGAATDDNRITKFVRVGRGLWRSRSPTPLLLDSQDVGIFCLLRAEGGVLGL